MGHTEGQLLICFIESLINRQIKGQVELTGTENDHGSLRILYQEDSEKLEDHCGNRAKEPLTGLLSAPGLSPAQTQTNN